MTSQDLDNIDWSFLREQEPWQFGQQNVTAAESDSASSQSLSTRNSRAPVLEREIGASLSTTRRQRNSTICTRFYLKHGNSGS